MRTVIGLTGGIASGKSTASLWLGEKGLKIIDADEISKEILEKDRDVMSRVDAAFPGFFRCGTLDRRALAAYVFSDPGRTEVLNSILHPAIIAEIRRRTEEERGDVVIDAPLLFETGLDAICDVTVVITCNKEERIRRAMERSGLSREETELRIGKQSDDSEKILKADYVVDNSGSVCELYQKLERLTEEMGMENEE